MSKYISSHASRGQRETAVGPRAEPTTGAHWYVAFGLSVRSDVELPEFLPGEPSDGPADVTIRRGSVSHPGPTGDDHRGLAVASREEFYLSLEVGDVVVRNGSEVVFDRAPDVDDELVRWYLVGSVFNHLLYQRGFLVLHASTVQVGDGAVCFLGESTAGKSTTALALLGAGYRVLADDVAAITFDGDKPLVQPGFPALKLDAATVSGLSVPLEPLPAQSPTLDRHFYRVPGESMEPLPISRLYSLATGSRIELEPLQSGEALMMLIRDTYTDLEIEGVDSAGANLERCGRLAQSVPVKTLRRRRCRSDLPAVVDAVLDDVAVD
ncbi:serine/threonine protein kinase [Salinigranum rubrum]|nr:serine/threonine protein kinase [Salinigranum rubrum]